MKIRFDFVSNSSSASFVLFGYVLKKDRVKKFAERIFGMEKIQEEIDRNKYLETKAWEEMDFGDVYEVMFELFNYRSGPSMLSGSDQGLKKDEYAFGFKIEAQDNCWDSDEGTYTWDEIQQKLKPVKEALEIEEDPVIIVGTRSC